MAFQARKAITSVLLRTPTFVQEVMYLEKLLHRSFSGSQHLSRRWFTLKSYYIGPSHDPNICPGGHLPWKAITSIILRIWIDKIRHFWIRLIFFTLLQETFITNHHAFSNLYLFFLHTSSSSHILANLFKPFFNIWIPSIVFIAPFSSMSNPISISLIVLFLPFLPSPCPFSFFCQQNCHFMHQEYI